MGLRFGDCELSPERFELRRGDDAVAVEPKVLQLLLHLVQSGGRVVPRAELLASVWPDVKVAEASLTRAVVEARRAIGDDAQRMIVTVRSRGFRFDVPVVQTGLARPVPTELAPPLVGREAPLAALDAQLHAAAAGRAAFSWVTGVPGIGKTRLLDELAARASRLGFEVHVAQCHESASRPPLRPWLNLLDGLARSGGVDAEAAFGARAALLELGSDVGSFDRVVSALVALGRTRPRLLCIDDLQWADEATLELVRFVAREARHAPLFVVCSFREATPSDEARSRAVANLLCEYGGAHLPLRGLSRAETAQLIGALKGFEPPAALVGAVHERTGGCPLFVRQILETDWAEQALRDEARSIATSVDMNRGLITSASRHLAGVSAPCRDVLVWAALLGKSFSFALLAAVTGLLPEALLDRLEEAHGARLVRDEASGHYRFVHPLVADVLYEELSPSERAARHRVVAQTLVAHFGAAGDLHAAQIARHFVRAAPTGSASEALDYCSRAARQSLARHDARGAVKHWSAALRMVDLIPASEALRLGVLLDLARTAVHARDFDFARRALLDAAILAQVLGKAEALARLTVELTDLVPHGDPRRTDPVADGRPLALGAAAPHAEELVRRLERAARPAPGI